MFTYEQQNNKPMDFESNLSPKTLVTDETEDRVIFTHEFHGNYDGVKVIGVYNKTTRTYEKFVSSIKLQLKDHNLKDNLDIYEFASTTQL